MKGWKNKKIKKPKNFEQYIEWLIQKGYMDSKTGHPLKCEYCGCNHHYYENTDYIEHILCEYDCICTSCGRVIGHWAYGYWQL